MLRFDECRRNRWPYCKWRRPRLQLSKNDHSFRIDLFWNQKSCSKSMQPVLLQKYEQHFDIFLHMNGCFLLRSNAYTKPHTDEQRCSKEFLLNLCMNMNRFESIQRYSYSNKIFNRNFGTFHIILWDHTK